MPDDVLPDARWGEADAPLPDWRDVLDADAADDDEDEAADPDVIEALGFDPMADDEPAEDALPAGLLDALLDCLTAELAEDDWQESDHPRGPGGQFGSGGEAAAAPKRSPEAIRRTLEHLQALADHPDTPKHEADAARGRIKELRGKYDLKPNFSTYQPLDEPGHSAHSAHSEPETSERAEPWTATPHGTYRNRAGYEHSRAQGAFPHPDYSGPSPKLRQAQSALNDAFRAMSANRTPATEAAFRDAHRAHLAEQDRDDQRRVHGDQRPAQDSADFAFDRSLRSYDSNGHLHVAACPISKANICGYYGYEIPDAERLGLDPQKLYQLYRDPDELAKGVATFNGLPILLRHQPVSADDHPKHLTVGTTGSEASFKHPYLSNALTIWDQDAIDGIEDEDRKQLSSAYRYRADMTPGAIDGHRYDGVMRDIRGNHVALVPEGRAGDDVVVGDQKPQEMTTMPTTKRVASVSRKALFLHGALAAYVKPKLAQDQKSPNLRLMLRGVTAKNWAKRRPVFEAGLSKALAGKLAQDASIDDIHNFIDSLDKPEPEMAPDPADLDDEEAKDNGEAEMGGELKPDATDDDIEDAEEFEGKETPEEEILEYLSTVLSPDQLAHVREIAQRASQKGNGEPPPAAPEAKDQEPDEDDDKRRREEADMSNQKPPAPVDRAAMDAAISAAVKAERTRATALREAERVVRPWIGDIAIAQDSADAVYRLALDSLGVKVDGVHPSAFRTILEMQPKPSEKKSAPTRVAMDAAAAKAFAERYPHANRLKQI